MLYVSKCSLVLFGTFRVHTLTIRVNTPLESACIMLLILVRIALFNRHLAHSASEKREQCCFYVFYTFN